MSKPKVKVAIDGPAGAGKSTAAHGLAKRLGFVLVDTGALYRGVALAAKQAGIDVNDAQALGALSAKLHFEFRSNAQGEPRLWMNQVDVSDDIRRPDISRGASDVSRHPEVRQALLDIQRQLGSQDNVVLEGRDIATVVFPDAEFKFFLTADVDARAKRRLLELKRRGIEGKLEEVRAQIQERDAQDSGRAVAPLKAAEDAIIIDSTQMSLEQVIEHLAELVQKGA
ncbi:MAG: (d)CMP kinase [Myxococcales bacterium]|nr:MAG: (d)CMP kinase [Myxococcales bacterium]